jgi:hypothetical protein
MKLATIYRIDCSATGRYYIGQSCSFLGRKHSHLSALYRGNHCNKELQKDFDRYGEFTFVFTMIRQVAVSEVLKEEQLEIRNARELGHPIYNGDSSISRRSTLALFCSNRSDMKDVGEPAEGVEEMLDAAKVAEFLKVKIGCVYRMMRRDKHPIPFLTNDAGVRLVSSFALASWINDLRSAKVPQI